MPYNLDSIIKRDQKYVLKTYNRQPVCFKEGSGAVLTDTTGKQYIDCVAGIAVNNVGHCHPLVADAIAEQAHKLIHTSNLYYIEKQALLAEKLAGVTGLERTFFCNSGAEAIEAGMKLARRVTKRTDFIAAEHAFHGRTMGSLAATHKEQYQKPFRPLMPCVNTVPYNDADAISSAITPNTAAVILEPIQGEGGIRIPDDNYLRSVREICDDNGTLLMLDEVQTGFGRTGKWFAKEHSLTEPDIMAMAKGLGGGFPMGAIAVREGLYFETGDHGTTFGGSPLACAASLASIEAIKADGLIKKSETTGRYFMEKLSQLEGIGGHSITQVRGKGLMIGVECADNCGDIVDRAREAGVIANVTDGNVIRFVPPLVITKEQVDTVVDVMAGI